MGHFGGAVDGLDRLIIQAQQSDGWIPFTQIARRVEGSETTIRARYQKLVAKGMVHAVGIVEPTALGYEAKAMVAVSVEPGMANQIARIIANVPEVSHFVSTLGSCDLILEVFCRDLSHLADVVT